MRDLFTLNESHNNTTSSLVSCSSGIGKPLNSRMSDLTLPKRGYLDINALSNNTDTNNITAGTGAVTDNIEFNTNDYNDETNNIADEITESNLLLTTLASTTTHTTTTGKSNDDDFAYTASDLFSTDLVTPDEEEEGHNSDPSLEGYSLTDFENKTRQKEEEEEQRLLHQQQKKGQRRGLKAAKASDSVDGRESGECSDDDNEKDVYNNNHKHKANIKVSNKSTSVAAITTSKASGSSSHDKRSKLPLTPSSITPPLLAPLPIPFPTPLPVPTPAPVPKPLPTPFSGDQDVLKALFGSHSIASIYDHDYLESGSGGGAHPSKLHPVGTYVTKAQLEKERIQRQIGNHAANAMLSLQSSAKVFIPTSSSSSSSSASYSKLPIPVPVPISPSLVPDSPTPRPVQANGGHIIQVLTDSDTNTIATYTTAGDMGSALVSSSSDLLAQIRKRKMEETASVNTARTSLTSSSLLASSAPSDHRQSSSNMRSGERSSKRVFETETEVTRNVIPLPTPSPLVPFSSSTTTTTAPSITAPAPTPAHQHPQQHEEEEDGLEATLLRRLHLLFRQRGPQLSTEKILNSFTDLGMSPTA